MLKFSGKADIYVLFILTGIIGISYFVNGGVLPVFTPDNQIKKIVSKVAPFTREGEDVQTESTSFNSAPITLMPTPTSSLRPSPTSFDEGGMPVVTPVTGRVQNSESIALTLPSTPTPTGKSSTSKEQDGLQLKTINFDSASVTVMPTPSYLSGGHPVSPTVQEGSRDASDLSAAQNPDSPAPTESSSVSPIPTETAFRVSPAPTKVPSKPIPTFSSSHASTSLSSFQKNLLTLARSQKGERYGMGSCQNWTSSSNRPSNPPKKSDACTRWDCSNWVAWVYYWATSGKIVMESQTCSDFGQCRAKYGGFTNYDPPSRQFTKYSDKDIEKIQFGDIVYFGSRSSSLPEVSHVGIYFGEAGSCGANDCIIDASASGGGVSERSLAKVPKTVVGFLRPKI